MTLIAFAGACSAVGIAAVVIWVVLRLSLPTWCAVPLLLVVAGASAAVVRLIALRLL